MPVEARRRSCGMTVGKAFTLPAATLGTVRIGSATRSSTWVCEGPLSRRPNLRLRVPSTRDTLAALEPNLARERDRALDRRLASASYSMIRVISECASALEATSAAAPAAKAARLTKLMVNHRPLLTVRRFYR
jgi:hypothetical protein